MGERMRGTCERDRRVECACKREREWENKRMREDEGGRE